MNDLERVMTAAKAAETKQTLQQEALRSQEIARQNKAMDGAIKAEARLQEFAESVKKEVKVYVRRDQDTVSIAFSTSSPLLRRPFRQILVSPGWGQSSYQIADKFPRDGKEARLDVEGIDELMKVATSIAADLIAKRATFAADYATPIWYAKTGEVLGWTLFALTWFACMFGGLWGLFLGWLPAGVLGLMFRYLWLPLIVVAPFALQKIW